MQDNMDEMMEKRYVPEVSGDLAERIVAATQPQRKIVFFQRFIPIYLTAALVVLLVAAGLYINGTDLAMPKDTPDAAMDDIAMYMVYESLEFSAESVL